MTSELAQRSVVLLATVVTASALTAARADATPPSGLSGRILGQATIGHTDYVLREITLAPGGSTGWHFHDGQVRGVVRSGVLTHVDADCRTVRTYRAGQVITEQAGAGHVHLGRNDGRTPMVLDVVYIKPTDTPLAEDAAAPACASTATPLRPGYPRAPQSAPPHPGDSRGPH